MKNIILIFSLLCMVHSAFAQRSCPPPTERQDELIQKLQAPLREKVNAILEADKTGQYDRYKADSEAYIAEKDPVRQIELGRLLRRNHYNFIKTAFQQARIDMVAYKRDIAAILGNNNFTIGEFGDISGELIPPDFGFEPIVIAATMRCPFTPGNSSTNGDHSSASSSSCSIGTGCAEGFMGSCGGETELSATFTQLQGPFSKMRVSSKAHTIYLASAHSFLGYCKSEIKIGFRITGGGVDQTIFPINKWCVAPVAFFQSISFNQDNAILKADFNGNFTPGTGYTITQSAEVKATNYAVVGGASAIIAIFDYDFIAAKGQN